MDVKRVPTSGTNNICQKRLSGANKCPARGYQQRMPKPGTNNRDQQRVPTTNNECQQKRNINKYPSIYWSSNPPAPLEGATRLRCIKRNPVSSVPCILCTLFSVSRFPVSVSGSRGPGFRNPGIMLLKARQGNHLPPTWRGAGSGMTPESP